ncbi:kinase-like domain-containing protein [Thamnidium elegans]|nr:kinase-like domain-containing protein [Thamnidium elegans]
MPVATTTSNPSWSNSDPADTRIAVIETSFVVSNRPCTMFHLILEDKTNHYSLVRFMNDFTELDKLLHKHFPKQRIPLPKLTDAFSTKKRSLFSIKKRKSNAKLLENYLYQCINNRIGHSSLFRDFLSAQRDEDKVISKSSVHKLVVQHVTRTNSHEQPVHVTPAYNTHSCQHDRFSPLSSPPSSFSDHSSAVSLHNSIADFPDYGYHSNLTSQDIVCSSMSEQEDEKCSSPSAIHDFQLIKVLGKGATGKVILVRHQTSQKLYALKSMTKAWHITEREVSHIRTERDILATIAEIHHPFLVRLHQAFQDHQNLYLVLDYHAGADLSTLLQRCHSIPETICRIYAAEIIMGLQELHRHSILYRDLKPENVLVAADGHLVLTDFGLSKMFDHSDTYYHRTTTFCGTPDYMAPEIILQEEEYSYAADYWSFGTMLYEMLTGITPFAAETHDQMYQRVLFDDLIFPNNFDPDAADLITGFLRRDPFTRLSDVYNVRTHPYFTRHLNWKDVHAKRVQPSYIPARQFETDLCNFDPDFLNMSLAVDEEDSSLYRQRWHPGIRPAGLNKNAFRGYSYIQDDTRHITYQSEMSFSTEEYISDDEDDEYYRITEQAMIDSFIHHLPVPSITPNSQVSQAGLKRSLRPTVAPSTAMDSSTFNYNQDIGIPMDLDHPTTYDTNDAAHDLIDQLFDDMQVPSFARGPSTSKKDLKRPLSVDRSNRLEPVPFNYNQNIRNSKIMNSTVKDDDLSTWRS